MDQQPQVIDPLLAHFSGKRRSERVPFVREVQAIGAGGTFRSVVQDISEGGILVQVDDVRFYEMARRGGDGLALVQSAFPEGLEISFADTGVKLQANVVRITPLESGGIALGCRFAAALEEVDRMLLGVHAASIRSDGPSESGPQLTIDASAGLSLFAFGCQSPVVGPAFLGAVVGAGPHSVIGVSAPGMDEPRRIAADLAGARLRLVIRRGGRILWEPSGRALHCRAAEGGGVEVRFGASEALPRPLERFFRARVTAVA